MSVVDFVQLASSVALRTFARLSSSLSVGCFSTVSSTLSLRRFARCASSLSVVGLMRIGGSFSGIGCARFASSLAVLDFVHLASSLSLRSCARLGSALSVLDYLQLGSSMSLRSYSRLGASVSLLDILNVGASLSVRSYTRMGDSVSVQTRVEFPHKDTYAVFNSPNTALEFYIEGKRSLSVLEKSGTGGGMLHGVWYSDHLIHTSDRRLKSNIRPLMETLNVQAGHAGKSGNGAVWVLRELRPVSYRFRRGAESKLERFGFIADDVAATIPQVVHETPSQHKGIAYQDLIAVLVAAFQSVQQRLDVYERDSNSRLEAVELGLHRLQSALLRHAASVEAHLQVMGSKLKASTLVSSLRL